MKKTIYIWYLALCVIKVHGFSSIPELHTYTNKVPEFPQIDNNNWNDPVYTTFYTSMIPSTLTRWLNSLGIATSDLIDLYAFKSLILELIEDREQKNLSGRPVAQLTIEQPITLYVLGDVQAQLHSFTRILSHLQKQGTIDNEFKIKDTTTYIIFNGDLINRSPYSIECLFVAMKLMQKNPDQVFYIRGKHEDKNYWQNFGLKRELTQRAHHLLPFGSPADAIPMGDLIMRFFDTLPLALYISTKAKPLELIRISHASRENPELKEHLFNDFFTRKKDSAIDYYDVRIRNNSQDVPDIKALITSEDWLKEHRATQGLGLLDQDLGTTSWSVVSTPIMAYRNYYKFFYDAFAQINVNIPIDKSVITLWNNNTKTPALFEKQTAYMLVTSIPASEEEIKKKVTPEIKIGSTMALKRGVAIMGKRIKRGMDIRINEQNQKGGINGQHIQTIIYNDDYTPFLARQNINRLIHFDKTNLILLPVGSPTLASYVDYVKENIITVLFPITGDTQFRTKDLKGIINFRPTYSDEVQILLDYLFTEYGARKFLFFYQNDTYGLGPLAKAHEELEKRGITDWIDVPYARGETNLKRQAETIKNAQVDAIGLFSTAKTTEELFRQIGIDSLSNKKLFGISFVGEVSFREYIKDHGLEVLLGAAVPNPAKSNLEAAQIYRKAMDKSNLPYDVFSLEAFITTSLLIDVMNRIKGPITRDKIVEKLESFYDDKFHGLTLTYNPATRSLARYVWIETTEREEWIEKKIPNVLDSESE